MNSDVDSAQFVIVVKDVIEACKAVVITEIK